MSETSPVRSIQMSYLRYEILESIDPQAYRAAAPYPWVAPAGLLSDAGYAELYANLPDLTLFEPYFDVARRGGQAPHDRYTLEYKSTLPVPRPWHEFVAELRGERYRRAVCGLVGVSRLEMNFHWHYTPKGCSVSPHCDARRKLGSHIFYFNTERDWDEAWGGQTVVLDDRGRFAADSAPKFEDFESATTAPSLGNCSLLFSRRGNSWHGVREISCPEGHFRRVFIAVLNRSVPFGRIGRKLFGSRFERY